MAMPKPGSVEEYLSLASVTHRALLETLRATIRKAAPGATEVIAYGMPAFRLNEQFFLSYSDFKRHVSLYPASGAVRQALGDELAPYFSGKGTLRFRDDQPLPTDLVRRIVAVRLDEVGAT